MLIQRTFSFLLLYLFTFLLLYLFTFLPLFRLPSIVHLKSLFACSLNYQYDLGRRDNRP
jgi:hypothetical protein